MSDSGQLQLPPLVQLSAAIDDVRSLLARHGDHHISQRLGELQQRLNAGDRSAVQSAISETTGGMGSLNDRILSRSNGDLVGEGQERRANAELRLLILAMHDCAVIAR